MLAKEQELNTAMEVFSKKTDGVLIVNVSGNNNLAASDHIDGWQWSNYGGAGWKNQGWNNYY